MITFKDITSQDVKRLPPTGIEEWDRDGVLTLKNFIPHDLIDAYVAERSAILGNTPKWRPGWNDPVPYIRVPSMKALATHRPLTEKIRGLIGGDEPGLHLCLTGFQSTERAYHQDAYLNPEAVGERYIAAWIALDDVHEDSGPFEYVPGSHRWPVIQRGRVLAEMDRLERGSASRPTWPSDSQGWVGKCCEDEILARSTAPRRFLPLKGDVLLWHASLVHRGSLPRDPALERRSLIAHYSSIQARPDMPHLRKLENGSFYFHFDHGMTEPLESTHKSKDG